MTKNEERLWDCWKEFVSTYEGSGFSYQFIKQSECVAPVRNVMRLTVPIRPLATPFIYMKVQKEFEQWLKDKHNWKIKLYFHVVVWNESIGELEMLVAEAKSVLAEKMN